MRAQRAAAMLMLAMASTAFGAEPTVDLKFAFTPRPQAGYTSVPADAAYSAARGYGFDLGSKVIVLDRGGTAAESSGCATGLNDQPFFFSAKLAPGAYRVTVTLGDPGADSVTTVKSETRRLHIESLHTTAGHAEKRSFLVHVRVPEIPEAAGGDVVKRKQREIDPVLYVRWDPTYKDPQALTPFTELDWDEKLTLAFTGRHPALQAVEIAPADKPTTVYLIGDSTMTDQMMEPWAAWGQMFPRFFKEPVLIANYAECGETTASFIGEKRWAKIMSEIKPGDYVLMQFGINDQAMPMERFAGYFVQFIDDTRAKGATPILVTSQNLKRLDANGKAVQTLRGFPDAMKKVAADKKATLIDLNEMSMRLYEALGPDKLGKAFTDGTHHSDYGAYELAKCVVQGLIDAKVPFADAVVEEWKPFDPAHPDEVKDFLLPMDAQWDPAFDSPTKTSPAGLGVMAGAAPRGRGAGTQVGGRQAGPGTR
jgi:lysophospholipase L1-like esterase